MRRHGTWGAGETWARLIMTLVVNRLGGGGVCRASHIDQAPVSAQTRNFFFPFVDFL